MLCLGAHPDDIEIGCGGTLLTLAAARAIDVRAVIMTGDGKRRDEALHSLPLFCPGMEVDIKVCGLPDGRLPAHWDATRQALEDAATGDQPDIILAPRNDDAHQAHAAAAIDKLNAVTPQ